MKLTLSIDESVVKEAQKVAESMGKSLNQLIRDYLKEITSRSVEEAIAELRRLSAEGKGQSRGWKFNRDEIYERR